MKNFIEVDGGLTDLELAWDKIAVICNNVIEDYFLKRNQTMGF